MLLLVAEGLSNRRIARRLDVTEASVKSSINRAMRRLGVANRAQAALLVRRDGGGKPVAVPDTARV